MTTNDNNNKNNAFPEYIQGIPTAKNKSRERIDLIKKYYSNLWKKLQKEGRSNKIFNNYLGVDVYIVEKESDKKPSIPHLRIGNQHMQLNILKMLLKMLVVKKTLLYSLRPKKELNPNFIIKT